jgi:hypothetical protein
VSAKVSALVFIGLFPVVPEVGFALILRAPALVGLPGIEPGTYGLGTARESCSLRYMAHVAQKPHTSKARNTPKARIVSTCVSTAPTARGGWIAAIIQHGGNDRKTFFYFFSECACTC